MIAQFYDAVGENELLCVNSQINSEAFDYLYNKYAPALYGIILRVLPNEQQAAEALEQTFLHVWHSAYEFNAEKERLFTWLHRKVQDQIIIVQKKSI